MNKVVIVGGDHHNGLGLARALGINGIDVDAVVIDSHKKSFLRKSKYIESCRVFPSEREAFDWIKKTYSSTDEKVILMPCSDRAAEELDNRLDEFKTDFFVPSISSEQGKIATLMNKTTQYELFTSLGFNMAKSFELKLTDESVSVEGIPFPCIVKPVVSAEGDKKDITICETAGQLHETLEKYISLGYKRTLVQQYLKIDYEIDVFGCVMRGEPGICMVPTHTLRAWPSNGGTNSFSFIITDEKLIRRCREVIASLAEIGYYGLYDIELFVVGDMIYLNEVNFRNSGDVYMALNQKYYYPVAWYRDVLGLEYDIPEHPARGDYAMTEFADLRHVFYEKQKFSAWLKDYRKCSDYALKFKGDMSPAYCKYFYYVKKLFSGNRK